MATATSNNIYNTVRRQKPEEFETYNPEYKAGQTVDTSPLKTAIGTGPRQVNPPQATTPQTFTMGGLQSSINKAATTGSPVATAAAKYQDPNQLMQSVGAITQQMQPLVNTQTQAAQASSNDSMNKLRAQWAARGLLASGGAAAQERQAADNLASTVAGIQAKAQSDAIPLALQLGQLGLTESDQLFNQQVNNRDFAANQAQQNVVNLLNSIGQQENMRQFEQNLGMDVERLKSQENQNYIGNLANATQQDIGQNQWSQEYGLNQQANAFNRWLQTNQLNSQNLNNWLGNLISAGGLTENARQFNDSQATDAQKLRENQRQFNIGAATDLSKLYGTTVMPSMQGSDLFSQVAGRSTIDSQQLAQNTAKALQDASGYYTDPATGEVKPTWEREYGMASLAKAAARGSSGGSSGSGAPSATDYTNLRWVDEQARMRAGEDGRKWAPQYSLDELTQAYQQMGMTPEQASQAAQSDERYKTPAGKFTENELVDAYKRDLYSSLGYYPE